MFQKCSNLTKVFDFKEMHKKRIRNKLAKRYKKQAISKLKALAICKAHIETCATGYRVKTMLANGANVEAAQAYMYYTLNIGKIWNDVTEAKRIDEAVFYRDKMGLSPTID